MTPFEDGLRVAIEALTAAAQGDGLGPRADFGELVCLVVTAVAANLGGTEAALARRPGSWEADLVAQILDSTAPGGALWAHRTRPVEVPTQAVDVFGDFGLQDMWLAESDAVSDLVLVAEFGGGSVVAGQALEAEMSRLWVGDLAQYSGSYAAAMSVAGQELGLTVPVVAGLTRWWEREGASDPWDELAEHLDARARQLAVLPASGEVPDWSAGSPADGLRRAGLTYTARARQNLEGGDWNGA
jgi:hypothetical protein